MNILNAQGRVFITEAKLYGDNYEYHGCMRAEGLSKQGRTVAPQYAGAAIAAQISTRGGLWTVSLTGHLAYDSPSILKRAFDSGCVLQVQIHYGTAGSPSDFTNYEAAWVLENAFVTDYSTTPLVAGSRGDTALLSETVTLSFEDARWITPPTLRLRRNVTSGAVVAMTSCSKERCHTCAACGRIYLLIAEQIDEDTQAFRIMWSDNEGATWKSSAMNKPATMSGSVSTANYLKIACSDKHLFIAVANQVMAVLHTSLLDTAPFTPLIVQELNSNVSYMRLDSNAAGVYAMSNEASVYFVSDSLVAELLIDQGEGVATSNYAQKTYLFHAFFSTSNTISRLWTNQAYRRLSTIVGSTPITALIEDKDGRGWAATEDGQLFCGGINGAEWRKMASFAPDCVADLIFLSHSIGYAAAGPHVYQTINAGYTWERLPQAAPGSVQLLAFALCGDGALYVGGADMAGSDCISLSLPPETARPVFARVV